MTSDTTCKLFVAVAPAAKFGDELARQLEDENRACFVVNYDHMTVLVHRDALWPHQATRAKLRLMTGEEFGWMQPGTSVLLLWRLRSTSVS